MIKRELTQRVLQLLSRHAAVALLGPRQVGKTTLARDLGEELGAVYLDLEAPADQAKLSAPELYLRSHADRLVILDEVQHCPDIFRVLRGLIDEGRRSGSPYGRFLALGSASPGLLRQSSESLAGRIVYVELGPLTPLEVAPGATDQERLWLRGGFPESLLARDDEVSLEWRQAFIRTYLERDVPQLGPRLPAETLRRFWTMLANGQGGTLNAARLAAGLGVSGQTVARYLDLLVDLLLVRRLPPWAGNVGKRLVRSPKVYVRDSGIVHALLGIRDMEGLLGHPVVGGSWEGLVIESLLAAAPEGSGGYFFRTSGGAEVDLVLVLPSGDLWAIEIKRSLAPKVDRGFHSACVDLKPTRRLLVYPGTESFVSTGDVEVVGVIRAASEARAASR